MTITELYGSPEPEYCLEQKVWSTGSQVQVRSRCTLAQTLYRPGPGQRGICTCNAPTQSPSTTPMPALLSHLHLHSYLHPHLNLFPNLGWHLAQTCTCTRTCTRTFACTLKNIIQNDTGGRLELLSLVCKVGQSRLSF